MKSKGRKEIQSFFDFGPWNTSCWEIRRVAQRRRRGQRGRGGRGREREGAEGECKYRILLAVRRSLR
jgi:hypothetical protein